MLSGSTVEPTITLPGSCNTKVKVTELYFKTGTHNIAGYKLNKKKSRKVHRPVQLAHVYPQCVEEQHHIFHSRCVLLLDGLDY